MFDELKRGLGSVFDIGRGWISQTPAEVSASHETYRDAFAQLEASQGVALMKHPNQVEYEAFMRDTKAELDEIHWRHERHNRRA